MFNPLSLIRKNKRNKSFLAIDLGSSLIKISRFSFLPDNRLLLEDISTVNTPEGAVGLGVITDLDSTFEALKSSVSPYDNVIFGLSGESVFGFATTVKIKRPAYDEKISSGELNEIIKRIQELAFIEAGQIQLSKIGCGETDIEMVNSAVISSKIDGALVEDVVGKVGKHIEIGLFTSFAEKSVLSGLLELCKKLKINFTAASSQMYSLSKLLCANQKGTFNAVLIDFGGDKTDVGICYGGGIVATKTLDFGGTQLTKEIAAILDVALNEAEKKKVSYEEGTLGAEQIKEITSKVLNYWLAGIETVLENFEGIKVFPPKIFIFGGGGLTYDLMRVLKERSWYENFPFKFVPEVEIVSIEKLSDIIEDPNGFLKDLRNIVPVSLGLIGLEIFG
ncbi:MAG: cell division FtsA domain-containing protein [Patescibacteria group bacterium]|nr:pilus assembly protein PilM [Patescibacteria group bacterium]